jgi:antitoxin (DNA-binding transcriptional repressor) of toxin-antitoxin stability system
MVATTLDMRYKTRKLLDSLARGSSIVITYRGRKTGILSPYREGDEGKVAHVTDHPFFGSAVPDSATESVEAKMDALRGGRFNGL